MQIDLPFLDSNDTKYYALDLSLSESIIKENFHLLPEGSESFSEKRKHEFVAGRICAKSALQKIGFENHFVMTGDNREPIWPGGVVGSITHNKNMAISIVSKNMKSLGVDVEGILEGDRFNKLKSKFLTEEENKSFKIDEKLGTLIFSAKESLYKALYPTVKEFFSFYDAQVIEINEENIIIKVLRSDGAFSQFKEAIRVDYCQYQNNIITMIKIINI